MQDMMPQLGAGAQLVRAYGPEGFRIGQDSYAGHVLVLPAHTVAWSGELTIEALAPIFFTSPLEGEDASIRERVGGRNHESPHGIVSATLHNACSPSRWEQENIELLIIGTGKRHEMIAPELKRALKERGVGIDPMDTGAACRTFNVLLGEGRRVAAALLLP